MSNIIAIKKIVGNNPGIYAITDDSAIKIIDVDNNVVCNLSISKKIQLFNLLLNKMINKGINNEELYTRVIFDQIMDLKNKDIENGVNELFKKVLFLYSKPHIDINEILSIADLVSNKLNEKSFNNDYVKHELQKKLSYL